MGVAERHVLLLFTARLLRAFWGAMAAQTLLECSLADLLLAGDGLALAPLRVRALVVRALPTHRQTAAVPDPW